MSYILEALADSEQARLQVSAAPKYSLLPAVGEEPPHHRRWPYALAGALLVNAAVLQVWLRPALPDSVASIKAPLQVAETPAASTPGKAPSARSEPPAADMADLAAREAKPPQPQLERVNDRRVAASPPAPADVVASTAPANPVNDSALMHIPDLARGVMTKRSLEAAVATEAKRAPALSMAKRGAGAAVAIQAKPTPATTPSIAKRGAEAAVATEAKPTPTPIPSIATRSAEAAVATVANSTLSQTSPTAPSPIPTGDTAEMPRALQQEMPALSVAGFIRDEGSSSMVIVNDRLVREGDEVAPGVTLEKIVNDSLVFNYKGYRFKR